MMYTNPDKVDLSRLDGVDLSDIENYEISIPDKPSGITGENPMVYASEKTGKKIVETMGNLIGCKAYNALQDMD